MAVADQILADVIAASSGRHTQHTSARTTQTSPVPSSSSASAAQACAPRSSAMHQVDPPLSKKRHTDAALQQFEVADYDSSCFESEIPSLDGSMPEYEMATDADTGTTLDAEQGQKQAQGPASSPTASQPAAPSSAAAGQRSTQLLADATQASDQDTPTQREEPPMQRTEPLAKVPRRRLAMTPEAQHDSGNLASTQLATCIEPSDDGTTPGFDSSGLLASGGHVDPSDPASGPACQHDSPPPPGASQGTAPAHSDSPKRTAQRPGGDSVPVPVHRWTELHSRRCDSSSTDGWAATPAARSTPHDHGRTPPSAIAASPNSSSEHAAALSKEKELEAALGAPAALVFQGRSYQPSGHGMATPENAQGPQRPPGAPKRPRASSMQLHTPWSERALPSQAAPQNSNAEHLMLCRHGEPSVGLPAVQFAQDAAEHVPPALEQFCAEPAEAAPQPPAKSSRKRGAKRKLSASAWSAACDAKQAAAAKGSPCSGQKPHGDVHAAADFCGSLHDALNTHNAQQHSPAFSRSAACHPVSLLCEDATKAAQTLPEACKQGGISDALACDAPSVPGSGSNAATQPGEPQPAAPGGGATAGPQQRSPLQQCWRAVPSLGRSNPSDSQTGNAEVQMRPCSQYLVSASLCPATLTCM